MRYSLTAMFIGGLLTLALMMGPVTAQSARSNGGNSIQQLQNETLNTAQISVHRATGSVSFVKLVPGSVSLDGDSLEAQARFFFNTYGEMFGIKDMDAQLTAPVTKRGQFGGSRLTYQQIHQGVPVFGGMLQTHFNGQGDLVAVNGVFVPDVNINPNPARGVNAEKLAIRYVSNKLKRESSDLIASTPTLYVYREGLIKGVPGQNRLVFEVEVGNGRDVREFAYVDAHNGDLVNMITGTHSALERQVHQESPQNAPIWVEGDSLPYDTGNSNDDPQINTLINVAADSYNLFLNVSSGTFDSWNGQGATMITVYNDPTIDCPNANWNGFSTNYCDGVTSDDVVAHEWTHAYTDGTHNLIYQWQSGALNESYSDIFGETADLLNDEGTDEPAGTRTEGDCSIFGNGAPVIDFSVNSPSVIAGNYAAAGANFNPTPPFSITGDLELADDQTDVGSDGCTALVDFTPGKIAVIDRGACSFVTKVANAITAGAAGVIIVNNTNGVIPMGGDGPLSVPSTMVDINDGALIKAQMTQGETVNVTIQQSESTANSVRWLMGEDSTAFNGAIRDMWSPNCFGAPGKVSDTVQYVCGTGDSGGVHTNSGVPNHAYALLVDGGTYNGHTVGAIGLTKAAAIYWRAMSVYQTLTSNFQDHADALEQACADLVGIDLPSLTDGMPSGEMITLDDCQQVANAMLAVEMRMEPTFCGFSPMLSDVDDLEGEVFFEETFDTNPGSAWTLTNEGVFADYIPRDWFWTNNLPAGGEGGAFFGADDADLGDCDPANNNLQAGVMFLDSPEVTLPGRAALTFDHWVATELAYDGGNVSIKVNGGDWTLLPGSAFIANGYPGILATTAEFSTNPLQGQEGFSGADEGSVGGSWGQSQVDLSGFAGAGDTIQIRFSLGADDCGGLVGWYIDNVTIVGLSADKVGVFRPSNNNFYMDSNGDGVFATGDDRFRMGGSGDLPLVGDWNGDGIVDIGVFRPGNPNSFYLRLMGGATFTGGVTTVRYTMGGMGDIPVVGDWDGNGSDTIGIYRPSNNSFIVRYGASNGVSRRLVMGAAGDMPVVGDWDGNGSDSVGIYRPSNNTFYLRNNVQWSGFASLADVDIRVRMGAPGDLPITGDWNGDGATDWGVFRPATGGGANNFFLNNGSRYQMGGAGDMPITGNW